MSKKQSCRSNRICFTLNNYTAEENTLLREHLTLLTNSKSIVYAIVGKEIGASGTPHLQGYISCPTSFLKASAGTVSKWKSLMPSLTRAHLESARGTDVDSKTYCSKDGNFQEWGVASAETRSRWTQLAEVTSMEEARELDPEVYVKNYFQVQAIVQRNLAVAVPPQPPTRLRRWQAEVYRKLRTQNDRQILFVQDPKGNNGKSKLARYILDTHPDETFYCNSGKSKDVSHAISKVPILKYAIFDYPRNTHPQFLPWNILEGLKDGLISSPKYDSRTLKFHGSVKVLVLTNHDLSSERARLTDDRWSIIDLDATRSTHGDVYLTEMEPEDPSPPAPASPVVEIPEDMIFDDDFNFDEATLDAMLMPPPLPYI